MTDSGTSSDTTAEYPRAVKVAVLDRAVKVWLPDGRTLTVPLEWYPMLCDGTPTERDNRELIGDGVAIHRPDLDEDIGVEAMLAGVPCLPVFPAHTIPGRWADGCRPAGKAAVSKPMRSPLTNRYKQRNS